MKVLQVVDDRNPMGGGVARHVEGLCRTAAAHGVETALAPDLPSLRRQLAGADLVHIHGGRSFLSAAAGLICRWRGVPFVYTPHCYYDHGSPLKRLLKRAWDKLVERWLHRTARASILLSQEWLEDARRRGFTPARPVIVPNCVSLADIEARRTIPPAPEMAGSPALLSISRLDPIKRLEDAIEALTQPALEGARLHLVGTGADEARLRRIAARLGLEARVHFHGWLDDKGATALLRAADIFVLPSAREGMPTTMLEAMLLGCPVVASDTIGCKAIAAAAGWPHIHPVGDVAALARLVAGKPALDKATVAILRDGFTWERRIGDLLSVYADAAQRRQGNGGHL